MARLGSQLDPAPIFGGRSARPQPRHAGVRTSAGAPPLPYSMAGVSLRTSTGWQSRYVAGLAVVDAVALLLAAVIAQLLRFEGFGATIENSVGRFPYAELMFFVAPLWVATLALCGVYERRALGNGSDEYRRILDAAVRFLAGVAIVVLALKLSPARTLVGMALPLATLLSVLNHYVFRHWLHGRRATGRCMQRVLVVGTEQQVADLVRHFRRASHAGLRVVGACLPSSRRSLVVVDGEPVPVVGLAGDIAGALERTAADAVAVADHHQLRGGSLRKLGWQLEGTGADLLVAPSMVDVAGPRIAIRPVAGLPLLHVEEPQLRGFSRIVKEGVERIAAVLVLLVLAPFMLAIAVAVRCTSKGPAIFKQVRLGQNSRRFTLYKFRTMRTNAESELQNLAHCNEHDGPHFKMRVDPRVTSLGRHLRRLSIDELPQLWNVAIGRMSIVGPRPPLPSEVEGYSPEARRRLLVTPGITGLWQISGRSGLSWDEAVRLDLYYVENWSLALDIVILGKTLSAVVRRDGAY